jgi:hypothetical protein
MQGLARAREKPPAQQQWEAMEKTMRRTMETVGDRRADLRPVVALEGEQWRNARVAAPRLSRDE